MEFFYNSFFGHNFDFPLYIDLGVSFLADLGYLSDIVVVDIQPEKNIFFDLEYLFDIDPVETFLVDY